MKIKGVFFDLFGTLFIYDNMIQAWSDWLTTFYDGLKSFGLKISKKSFAKQCDGFFEKREPPSNDDDLTIFERRIKALVIDLGLDLRNDQLSKLANSCVNAWQKYVLLDSDAILVLKTLIKNKTMAIISNFDHPPHVYELLLKNKLKHYFESTF